MRLLRFIAAAVVVSIAPTAFAQTPFQRSTAVQLFEPAIGTRDTFFTVEGASVARHLGFGVGLMANYQHKPLVLFVRDSAGNFNLGDSQEVAIVRNSLTINLYGAFGFHYKWLKMQVGLGLPINAWLRGNEVNATGEPTGKLSGEGLGDLRLQIKVKLLDQWKGLSIAASPVVTFPTGCAVAGGLSSCDRKGSFSGDSNLTIRPRLAIDWRYKKFLIAGNIGWLFRLDDAQVFSSEISDRLIYGLAAGYQVHKYVFLMAEWFGQAGFASKSQCQPGPDPNGEPVCSGTSSSDLDAFPMEIVAGAHAPLPMGLTATVGAGVGLLQALGVPQFRVLAGLRWAPDFRDSDKDGIFDAEDNCPTQPEDKDGFKDDDGCPDPDNDGDLIVDAKDKCPNQKEDRDDFQDEDGCPEPDNDGDGIPDIKDHCPRKPETKNGFKDNDGCPDVPDQDGDSVPDSKDKCPKEAEDIDKFEDEDGCPDPDNDGDGVPDDYDECKNEPEDLDKFKDEDGCPDPDNDGDGVPDVRDKCPNEKETINGYKDSDGCPDKGKAHVIIKANKIVIIKKVYFRTGRSKIKRRSYGILREVALTMQANQQIKQIRVEGHTDSRGRAKKNKVLSQKRAEAVRDFLIKQGVDGKRLVAVGYGPDKPIASNRTSRGRRDNRRVEFTILNGTAPKTEPQP